jgi:uncharacterized cupin superfamily protein
MPDFTAKRVDDMEGLFGGAMRRVRAELGLSSFGVQTVDLPPDFDGYPWHDHGDEGQEELYFAVRGTPTLEFDDGQSVVLVPGETFVRVGSGTKRRIVSGPDPARVLVIGGTPGSVYSPPEFSKLGGPEPAPG